MSTSWGAGVGTVASTRNRNRRIGQFLKELHLTEGRGTGIPKILCAMLDNGSPPAEFDGPMPQTDQCLTSGPALQERADRSGRSGNCANLEHPGGAGPQVVYGPVGIVPAASDGRPWVASHLAAGPG